MTTKLRKASQPPLSYPGATPDYDRAKKPSLADPSATEEKLTPGDRVEGLGNFGKPTGEFGIVEESNEDDAVVKWDGCRSSETPSAKAREALDRNKAGRICESSATPCFGRQSARCSDSLLFANENMSGLKLWLLVALLAVGSLMGCSRAYTTALVAPGSVRKSLETGPETTKGKPSACIKWVKGSGRTSKPLRKAVKITNPQGVAVNRENKLQANNEDHPQ